MPHPSRTRSTYSADARPSAPRPRGGQARVDDVGDAARRAAWRAAGEVEEVRHRAARRLQRLDARPAVRYRYIDECRSMMPPTAEATGLVSRQLEPIVHPPRRDVGTDRTRPLRPVGNPSAMPRSCDDPRRDDLRGRRLERPHPPMFGRSKAFSSPSHADPRHAARNARRRTSSVQPLRGCRPTTDLSTTCALEVTAHMRCPETAPRPTYRVERAPAVLRGALGAAPVEVRPGDAKFASSSRPTFTITRARAPARRRNTRCIRGRRDRRRARRRRAPGRRRPDMSTSARRTVATRCRTSSGHRAPPRTGSPAEVGCATTRRHRITAAPAAPEPWPPRSSSASQRRALADERGAVRARRRAAVTGR